MRKTILILTLIMIHYRCVSTDTPPMEIDFITIKKGILGGAGNEGIGQENFIITNKTDWESLKQKIDSVNPETKEFSETDVDFKKYTVIAIFDQVRPSSGWDVEVTGIEETDTQVAVKVKQLKPGDVSFNVFTQPYHIIKMKKTKKDIVFLPYD